jgi:hypothetical protein
MQKKICWKKGMRLSDDLLRASDEAMTSQIGNALTLAAAGQFGLTPYSRPFQISLNISNGYIEVTSLSCFAITKGGDLIDIQFDSKYSNSINCRTIIPKDINDTELYLTVNVYPDQWKETVDGYEEPVYDFTLLGANSPVAEHGLPIAHLVDTEYGGWHLDEIDFVPPCLYVSSHQSYEKLLSQFLHTLTEMENKLRGLINSEGREAVKVFWPIVQQIMTDVDCRRDLLTPMGLLAYVKKTVIAFTTACDLDDYLNLADADVFRNYALNSYSHKELYQKTKEGIEICLSINEKISKIQVKEKPEMPVAKLPAPVINNENLRQNCNSCSTNIPVIIPAPGATVFYSTDGGEPNQPLASNGVITFENGFNKKIIPEPDKNITIKLKAIANGISSEVATYTITLHKDFKVWNGYEI